VPVRNQLKRLIEQRGITVYQFMKDVGIAQRTAYDLCNNPNQLPSSTVLSKICDTYEVPVSDVLVWIPPQPEVEVESE
jgi:DNA-binding Xre family transcriptional regulator